MVDGVLASEAGVVLVGGPSSKQVGRCQERSVVGRAQRQRWGAVVVVGGWLSVGDAGER